VFASGAAFFGLFALPSFLLINTAQTVWIIVGLVIAFGVIYPAMYGPLAAFWSEMFDTRVRYSGVSFVYQFSGIFASGLTPLIATSLLAEAGGEPWLVAAYMVVVALISIAAAYFLKETFRKDITPTAANAQKESGPLAEPGS
jgi:MFS transporter, MHS family, shikimate and dehydroshikimate transport protein